MTFGDFLLLALIVVGILGVAFYYMNKWATNKMQEQEEIIKATRQSANIYVIDKKKDKIDNVSMPKMVVDQMPKRAKIMKMYFIKAKIGPQIMTLMCQKDVYEALTVKKNYKVELAGIYIVSVPGMKSKHEVKEIKKEKKRKAKEQKKANKNK